MFKKTFLKLSLQKCLDKLYSKCCKIFKAYLASHRVNFVLTQPRNYYFWFSWVFLFLKNKFVMQIFITWIIYWFTKKVNKACLHVIEICVSYCAIELEWIRCLWTRIWNLYHVKKEALSQAFSYKFCEFLHNNGFWDFLQIILQIFG